MLPLLLSSAGEFRMIGLPGDSAHAAAESKTGGQAVIEGVMMRSPISSAVAVRRKSGKILARKIHINQLQDRGPIWKRPVFRGAAILIDTLRLGMKALNWSVEIAEDDSSDEDKKKDPSKRLGAGTFLTTVLAFGLALALFVWLPLQSSKWLLGGGGVSASEQFAVHLLAGCFRIAAFLIYLGVISIMPDIRRLFMYHGAEHQTIHAWEKGLEPLVDRALEQSPLHQRCGTSFLLLVMLATVVFYGIFDSLVVYITGTNPGAFVRILYHLPMIPLVMGISYELLKAADSKLDTSIVARAITIPGLLLQRLTTRKAGREEIEVAVASLMLSLGKNPGACVEILVDEREESPRKST